MVLLCEYENTIWSDKDQNCIDRGRKKLEWYIANFCFYNGISSMCLREFAFVPINKLLLWIKAKT
jgi:hypothetical protein